MILIKKGMVFFLSNRHFKGFGVFLLSFSTFWLVILNFLLVILNSLLVMLNFLPVILNFLSVILNEVKNLVLWSFWSALRTRSFGRCPQDDRWGDSAFSLRHSNLFLVILNFLPVILNFLPVILNFLPVILNEVKNLVLWSFWRALRTRYFGRCL